MKFAFLHWNQNAIGCGKGKLGRVYERCRRDHPTAELRWITSTKELEEFAPDALFLEPPPKGSRYADSIMDYPCEKDFLENWGV